MKRFVWFTVAVLLAMAAGAASAQSGVYFQANNTTSATNVPPGSQAPVFTLPYSKVTVCAFPATPSNATCTNTVTVYSDQALSIPITQPISADSQGNFGFWVAAGQYSYSIQSSTGTYLATYPLTLGGAGGPVVAPSVNYVINAGLQSGSDIGAKVNAAITACNIHFMTPIVGAANLASGCTIEIPAQSTYDAWVQTTTILPPSTSYVPITLLFDSGASLYYTGSGWSIDAENLVNAHNLTIQNPTILGTSAGLGGIRLGPGFGMHVRNPYIAGFSGTGAVGIRFQGSDTDDVTGGALFSNYDNVQFEKAITGPATGASPNANLLQNVHIFGATHRQINGEFIGNGNRILDNTIEGPAGSLEVCGYFHGFNHLIVNNNYCEGIAGGASTVAVTGNVTQGSTSITLTATPTGVSTGQPISGSGIPPNATVSSIYGTSLTISTPAVATVSADSLLIWTGVTYGYIFSGGTDVTFNNNWTALTLAHASLLVDGAAIYATGNTSGGAEPGYIDYTTNQTAGIQSATLVGNRTTFGMVGLNPSIFRSLQINNASNDQSSRGQVSDTDPNIIGVDIFTQGVRLNRVVAPPTGLTVACGGAATSLMNFPGGGGVDCSGNVTAPAVNGVALTHTGSATTYLNGAGTYTTPSGGGGSGTVNYAGAYSPAYYPAAGVAVSGAVPFNGLGYFSTTAAPAAATSTQVLSSLGTQSANTVLAGPASGGAAAPAFRALVSADIPNNAANTTGTAGSVTLAGDVTGPSGSNTVASVHATSGTLNGVTIGAAALTSTATLLSLTTNGFNIANGTTVTLGFSDSWGTQMRTLDTMHPLQLVGASFYVGAAGPVSTDSGSGNVYASGFVKAANITLTTVDDPSTGAGVCGTTTHPVNTTWLGTTTPPYLYHCPPTGTQAYRVALSSF